MRWSARIRQLGINLRCSRGGLAGRAVVCLFALTLLAAQPVPQNQLPAFAHKSPPIDTHGDAKCESLALREALSEHRVMPDVLGCQDQAVIKPFKLFGGHEAKLTEQASTQPKGVILQQVPNPNTPVEQGEPVALSVSSGSSPPPVKPTTVVPRVIDQSAEAAEVAIHERQLRPALEGAEDGASQSGKVLRSLPPADTVVPIGSEVGYWTASGFNWVPDLHQRTRADAETALKQAGFGPATFVERSTDGNSGFIIDQQPGAGTRARLDTVVQASIAVATPVSASSSGPSDTWPTYPWRAVIASAVGGMLALGGGWWLLHQWKIARTRRLLKLKADYEYGDTTRFTVPVRFNKPTVSLRSSLEDGVVRSHEGLPILHVEIRHE